MRPLPHLAFATAVVLLCTSCDDQSLPPLPDNPAFELGVAEGRPVRVYVPNDYDPNQFYPLVILLHGYGASGPTQNIYLGLNRQVSQLDFIMIAPNGTLDSNQDRFWNATPRCCDRDGSGVDDEAYLRGLIEEAQQNYRIDPGRVYLFGHSNGGYMSFRMACTSSDVITAIATLAGGTFEDPMDCPAEQPVSVLAIHGTDDPDVLIDGLSTMDNTGYPSAEEAVQRFADRAGCDTTMPTTLPNIDVQIDLPGDETEVTAYRTGCQGGVDTELWRIVDGVHLPPIDTTVFTPRVIEWLLRHER